MARAASIGRALAGAAALGALAGCPQDIRPDPALASTSSSTSSTGSATTGTAGSTGGTGSTGSTGTSGTTGSPDGTLTGPLAFPVAAGYAYPEHFPDGGPDFHSVYIDLHSLPGGCNDDPDRAWALVRLHVTNFAKQPVQPGSYPVYNPYLQPLSGTSAVLTYQEGDGQGSYASTWRSQSGTFVLTAAGPDRFTGSFTCAAWSTDGGARGLPDGSAGVPIDGTFDVPRCLP